MLNATNTKKKILAKERKQQRKIGGSEPISFVSFDAMMKLKSFYKNGKEPSTTAQHRNTQHEAEWIKRGKKKIG
jgi:hypothetical protein